jgi:F420-dependent oxidoreductase-like protein
LSIQFGVTPIQTGVSFDHIREVVLSAEAYGYDSIWLNDHFFTSSFFYPLPPPTAPYYECWVTLSALAAITKRIRLGTLCTNISFRSPAVLAKMAACLDVISEGRLELGLGAGWFRDEHRAYGIPFPRTVVRAEKLREGIEIIRQMWTREKITYHGKHFLVEDAYCSPKPLQKPHPRIWVGARGSKIMIRTAAQCADNWNIQTPITPSQYQRKAKIFDRHCKEFGRSADAIGRSLWAGAIVARNSKDWQNALEVLKPRHPSYLHGRIAGTPEQCIETIKAFVELGVNYFILYFTVNEIRSLKIFAQHVIPALKS